MDPQKAHMWSDIAFFVSIGMFLAGLMLSQSGLCIIPLVLGVACMIVRFIILVLWWRCPHCRAPLPTTGMWNLTYCPNCGNSI